MDCFSLRKLQIIQLRLLLEVKRICDRHNISYCLIGGTLIGAVRHKGFIPWDDDIDVGMPRADYDKFREVCNDELPPSLYLRDASTSPDDYFLFTKLCLKNTANVGFGEPTSYGINIDIFPMDNIPSNSFTQFCQMKLQMLLSYLVWSKANTIHDICDNSAYPKLLTYPLLFLGKIIPKRLLISLSEVNLRRYQHKDTEYIVNLLTRYNPKNEIIKSSEFRDTIFVDYEEFQFPVPASYHTWLTNVYGDYMTPPPVEKRMGHSITSVNFGKYADVSLDPEKVMDIIL